MKNKFYIFYFIFCVVLMGIQEKSTAEIEFRSNNLEILKNGKVGLNSLDTKDLLIELIDHMRNVKNMLNR